MSVLTAVVFFGMLGILGWPFPSRKRVQADALHNVESERILRAEEAEKAAYLAAQRRAIADGYLEGVESVDFDFIFGGPR